MDLKRNQTNNEIRIFNAFAEVCSYDIDLNSIERRNPPEPDILCKLANERIIAFEIVECIDSSLSHSIFEECELRIAFDYEIERLPDDKKQRICDRFDNVMINIVFHKGVSLINKIQLIKPIFNQLWTVENENKVKEMEKSFSYMTPEENKQFHKILEKEKITWNELLKRHPFPKSVVKNFYSKFNANLEDSVKQIKFMVPLSSDGPTILAQDAKWLTDPVEKTIKKKLNEKYKTKHRAELLWYYEIPPELPPELPVDYWIVPTMDDVIEELEKSLFKRVWLFSVTQNKIIDVFPDLNEKSKT